MPRGNYPPQNKINGIFLEFFVSLWFLRQVLGVYGRVFLVLLFYWFDSERGKEGEREREGCRDVWLGR